MKDNVDIILPVYNGEEYLAECLESIRIQSHSYFRVFIINDGSKDNSSTIAEKLCSVDNRFFLINRPNGGLVKTLNYGLTLCSSKYIARMDADDLCHIDRLREQVYFLENNLDIHVCGTNALAIDKEGRSSFFRRNFKFPDTALKSKARMILRAPLLHPSVMFRNEGALKESFYYDESDYLCEDFALWMRLSNKGFNIASVQKNLLYYRCHENSLSTQYKNKMQSNACDLIKKYFLGLNVNLNSSEFESYKKFRNYDYRDLSRKDYFNIMHIGKKVTASVNATCVRELLGILVYITIRAFLYARRS